MAGGRTTEARTVTGVGTTNASTALTGAAGTFDRTDVGRKITGTGIPANATISAVASSTAATLSAAATATGTITATVAAVADGSLGFTGWSPETGDEANSYSVASNIAGTVSPDRQTTNNSPFTNSARRNR